MHRLPSWEVSNRRSRDGLPKLCCGDLLERDSCNSVVLLHRVLLWLIFVRRVEHLPRLRSWHVPGVTFGDRVLELRRWKLPVGEWVFELFQLPSGVLFHAVGFCFVFCVLAVRLWFVFVEWGDKLFWLLRGSVRTVIWIIKLRNMPSVDVFLLRRPSLLKLQCRKLPAQGGARRLFQLRPWHVFECRIEQLHAVPGGNISGCDRLFDLLQLRGGLIRQLFRFLGLVQLHSVWGRNILGCWLEWLHGLFWRGVSVDCRVLRVLVVSLRLLRPFGGGFLL